MTRINSTNAAYGGNNYYTSSYFNIRDEFVKVNFMWSDNTAESTWHSAWVTGLSMDNTDVTIDGCGIIMRRERKKSEDTNSNWGKNYNTGGPTFFVINPISGTVTLKHCILKNVYITTLNSQSVTLAFVGTWIRNLAGQ